jgi:uncharacterized membrane protein
VEANPNNVDAASTDASSSAVNELLARSLMLGIMVSFPLLTAGLIWTIVQGFLDGRTPAPSTFDGQTGRLHYNVALLLAGLLALLATPLLRLAAAIWHFYRIGDRRYMRIAGAVLIIVLSSVLVTLTQARR